MNYLVLYLALKILKAEHLSEIYLNNIDMNNCSFLEEKNTSKKGKTARKKNRSEISSKYAHFNFMLYLLCKVLYILITG